jgi:glucose-6-phosphate isomerase, archaeal
MIDLKQISGLPLSLTDDFHLQIGEGAKQAGPSIVRKFSEMQPVLFDRNAKSDRDDMYYVYRGICMSEDENKIAGLHLTYDVTVLPPLMLGEEYNKTVGHYHANIEGTKIAHPEMYEVLNGKGLFLLQKMDADMKNVVTILAIEGKTGDKIIYPPNYGHIIVNTSDEPLVTANWLSTDYKPLYEPVKDRQGMAIYVIKGTDGAVTFVKNENYADQPLMRPINTTETIRNEFGIDTKEPMYTMGMRNPELLDFLNHPLKYAVQLSALSS